MEEIAHTSLVSLKNTSEPLDAKNVNFARGRSFKQPSKGILSRMQNSNRPVSEADKRAGEREQQNTKRVGDEEASELKDGQPSAEKGKELSNKGVAQSEKSPDSRRYAFAIAYARNCFLSRS